MKRYLLLLIIFTAFFTNAVKSQCPPNAFAYASNYPLCPLGCGVLLKDWPEGVVVNIYGGFPLQVITSVIIPGVYGGPGVGSAFSCVPCNVPLVYASSIPGATNGCVITSLGIVPITLSDFSVSTNTNLSQIIKWTSFNESPDAQYALQKSYDGTNFNTITTISGTGGINKNYSFTDPSIINRTVSYRLKMTELSGTITYSKIIIGRGKASTMVTLYPNPTTSNFKIIIAESLLPAAIQIINAQGKLVFNSKTNSTVVDFTNDLQKGVYAVKVIGKNDELITQTIVKR